MTLAIIAFKRLSTLCSLDLLCRFVAGPSLTVVGFVLIEDNGTRIGPRFRLSEAVAEFMFSVLRYGYQFPFFETCG